MRLQERIVYFSGLFTKLEMTPSLIEKRRLIADIPEELQDDFNFCIEVLAEKHKLGYTYIHWPNNTGDSRINERSVKDVYKFLQTPLIEKDLSRSNINLYLEATQHVGGFLESLCNRRFKLGIGKSILSSDGMNPILAKKYEEGNILSSKKGYYVTEKLDGNRCVAYHDGISWNFVSRNGKPMHVNFSMSGLPTDLIYDGEILSKIQSNMSKIMYTSLSSGNILPTTYTPSLLFRQTSGAINSHTLKKDIVYNIFDIMVDNVPYNERREELNRLMPTSDDVRILPVLRHFKDSDSLFVNIDNMLNFVTGVGGEGLMINIGHGEYTHKRTNLLLKYKDVQTIDMKVTGIEYGTGKYDGMVGAISVECEHMDNKISCNVGSGLSDIQRGFWISCPDAIVGKIVEIAYFSLSQNSNTDGSKNYSLRFPRLVKVRNDKDTTSIY